MSENLESRGRMDELAVLPIFYKLGGRMVVMAGGTDPAVWKTELLSAAGARVRVFAEAPSPALVRLAAQPVAGAVELVSRSWQAADLQGATLAIGAIEAEAEASHFAAAARAAGVPVNVIDKPAFCDFQFGTIVARSPLVIGISTDGAAPVFGQAIRTRIEAILPQNLKSWAEAARDWRARIQAQALPFRNRRRFWERFSELALAPATRGPDEAAYAQCIAALGAKEPGQETRVTMVCAGSGAPESVTLAAVATLQSADLLICDSDVPEIVAGFGRREAERITLSADDVSADWITRVGHARQIAWLGMGDPDRCLRWRIRSASLGKRAVTLAHVPGIGRCSSCRPECPAWRSSR